MIARLQCAANRGRATEHTIVVAEVLHGAIYVRYCSEHGVEPLRDRNFHFLLATPTRSLRAIQPILPPLGAVRVDPRMAQAG